MTISQDVAVATSALSRLSDADLSSLLTIRHFEWQLLELFSKGGVAGTTHTCLGQEHVPVALSALMRPEDSVFSNHRGHGHYLARYQDPFGLLAEITGRQGAVCGGAGGSQHLFRAGFLSTGVQGQLMPVAVGVALDLKIREEPGVAVAFIGDGTWGQGGVYEALNLAQLWRVPLITVVENNGIAQSTPTDSQLAGSIAGRAAGFGIRYVRVTGLDVNAIREQLASPLEQARAGEGPLVIEFETYRLGPHSKGDDTRENLTVARLAAHDWYALYGQQYPEQFRRIDADRRTLVAEVVRDVMTRPLLGASDA
ncbi:thiamine pyrophosphate-dependent dehydrogenase E1 component subunit alpha [Streptomyces silvisoli]|uniref:Thiamine pyrophosphate-dependent dehydrogenase E1 component subunit alpha n=1 Tax=Streptomyces silvisoli TaxID=3034235 RepID=A0ABT5ZKD5_9ACTN|nr:thiamine pyrophosphate-dependent dehydrogenase E1 component subunit alpha [Streptomyces silvisoli]MDF3290285.1 thiamine pyrophosphate-dependent dehydrogenase E1 component subunit alpha [Streptomyces silvisoli]